MKRLTLATLALALVSACSGDPAPAPDASSELPDAASPVTDAGPTLDPRFEELAAAIEADIASANATGASVAVWLDDEIVWVGGFGTVDTPDGARSPDEETVFMIGSDTKKLTGILFLQEVAAGRATIETSLAAVHGDLALDHVPDFGTITAHELLSHQAGLVDGIGAGTASTTDEALRDTAYGAFARDSRAMAPHGLFFDYCNPGFAVAGLMTQTLGGSPWADLARTRLFAPLGMTRTFARKADIDTNYATGIGLSGPRDTTVGPVAFDATWEDAFIRPAGLVWSTPSDQMRVARFLVDGDESVLPDALTASLHAPHVPLHADLPGDYGYGLFLASGAQIGPEYYEVPLWVHGGNTLTHTSTFYVLPEQRFAIAILSNGYGDDFARSVVTAIRSLVTLPAPGTAPVPSVDDAALDALTGTYADELNVGDVIVTRDADGLAISMPALDAASIPYGARAMAISTRGWQLSIQGQPVFVDIYDGPSGETYMVHRAFVARRAAPAPTPPPTIASVPRAQPSRERILETLRRARLDPTPALLLPQRR